MTRLKVESGTARTITWQPGDGTAYTLVVLNHPHGGLVLWWATASRSTRKDQDALVSCYWSKGISFAELRDRLKRSMRLLPYDAEALAVCMAECGLAQHPNYRHQLKHFTALAPA